MKKKFHRLRRLTGLVLLIALIGFPFLQIKGQSAFRFDIPTLRLLFFGTEIWMADFFIILIAVIFLTFLTLFVTTVFGRLWCGWVCPQTVLADATTFAEAISSKRSITARIAAAGAGLAVSAIISASLIGYFVAPAGLPVLVSQGGAAARIIIGSWVSLSMLLYLDLALLRRKFCATVCPYAKMQGVLFDERTLLVAFDSSRADECMDCQACVKACPVGIDIRKGSQMACIHCAECVDACTERMSARGRKTLVDYSFGVPGSQGTGFRINALITGVITLLSLLFLIYLSASRMPFDLSVRLIDLSEPKQQAEGSITNVYELSLRNLTTNDLKLEFTAVSPSASASVSPPGITLRSGTDMTRVRVAVTVRDRIDKSRNTRVTLSVRSVPGSKNISRTVYFMVPNND